MCIPGHQLNGPQPNERLHQPSFSAHSIELSPLCNEISRGVHLRDVSFVHDDHSAKQQRGRKIIPPDLTSLLNL